MNIKISLAQIISRRSKKLNVKYAVKGLSMNGREVMRNGSILCHLYAGENYDQISTPRESLLAGIIEDRLY